MSHMLFTKMENWLGVISLGWLKCQRRKEFCPLCKSTGFGSRAPQQIWLWSSLSSHGGHEFERTRPEPEDLLLQVVGGLDLNEGLHLSHFLHSCP